MNDLTWDEFCELYYDTARQYAEINLKKLRKRLGEFDPHVDVDYVLDSATLKALEKAYTSFDAGRGRITTFLSTVVHNEMVDELRKQTREAGQQRDIDDVRQAVREFTDDDDSADARAKLIPRLMAAIDRLSPDDQVILFNYLEDPSDYVSRSAQALHISENYVSVRRNRIFKMLPKLMEMTREEYRRFCAEYERQTFADNASIHIGAAVTAVRAGRRNPILPSLDFDRMAGRLLALLLGD